MKCCRCLEVEIPSMTIYMSLPSVEQSRRDMYCISCWKIIQFEEVKFVKRPYKIPINRRGV